MQFCDRLAGADCGSGQPVRAALGRRLGRAGVDGIDAQLRAHARGQSADAAEMVQALPAAAQKVGRSLQGQRNQGPASAIDKVQQAASEIERAAQAGASATPAPGPGVAKVQIEKPKFNVKDYLWPGALGLAAAIGQVVVVLFIAYFLLAMGNAFRRKLVKLSGPDLSHKKLTLQTIDEINGQIQTYLLVQVSTSLLVGVATWLAFLWIGVDNAAVWGVVAFALNFIPYFGGVRWRAGLGLAMGCLGTVPGHADPDGDQGRLRPCRRPYAGGGTARRVNAWRFRLRRPSGAAGRIRPSRRHSTRSCVSPSERDQAR